MEALTLSLVLLSFMFTISTVEIPTALALDSVMLGGHSIEFLGVEYDPEGYPEGASKWTYQITAATGQGKGISHWVIAWCGGVGSILDASWDPWSYGEDPTTGVWGIKFDDLSENDDFQGESRIFWFVLNKNYTSGQVDIGVKDGAGSYTGTVTGPVFTYGLDLDAFQIEVTDPIPEGYSTWQMVATATTDYDLVTSVTFYWSGPFSEDETPDESRLKMTYMDNDGSDGFVSYYPGLDELFSDDDLGNWYVRAVFTGGRHPGEADGTVDPVNAPWFTSLPLTMLAAVGILALRKKGAL